MDERPEALWRPSSKRSGLPSSIGHKSDATPSINNHKSTIINPKTMTLYSVIFYALAALILVSTGLAITRRNPVHAVVYLIISFFGSAMLFYLLGAPLLAALEVIIYAGAIMVLFLFIIMMLKVEGFEEPFFPIRQWIPAAGICLVFIAAGTLMIVGDPDSRIPLKAAVAEPVVFGHYLFRKHWLAIEIVSLLLLIAVVAVLYLGKSRDSYK